MSQCAIKPTNEEGASAILYGTVVLKAWSKDGGQTDKVAVRWEASKMRFLCHEHKIHDGIH